MARGARRPRRGAGHARVDALHVLRARLHAQPHHAFRAHLLDRHPRRRRDRGRREHLPPPAHGRPRAGRRGGGRRGRSRQPDDPRHLRGHRGDPADGVRLGHDGPLHASDSRRRVGRDARVARGGVHRDAVARPAVVARPRAPGRRPTIVRTKRKRRAASPDSIRGSCRHSWTCRGAGRRSTRASSCC